jgi:hypothetical protein
MIDARKLAVCWSVVPALERRQRNTQKSKLKIQN